MQEQAQELLSAAAFVLHLRTNKEQAGAPAFSFVHRRSACRLHTQNQAQGLFWGAPCAVHVISAAHSPARRLPFLCVRAQA
jgi:hypothetical protein